MKKESTHLSWSQKVFNRRYNAPQALSFSICTLLAILIHRVKSRILQNTHKLCNKSVEHVHKSLNMNCSSQSYHKGGMTFNTQRWPRWRRCCQSVSGDVIISHFYVLRREISTREGVTRFLSITFIWMRLMRREEALLFLICYSPDIVGSYQWLSSPIWIAFF